MKRVLLCTVLVFTATIATGSGAVEAEEQRPNVDEAGVAISGYDPVAYFVDGQPMEGLPRYTYTHNGSTYRFASSGNRERFASDPERYAPAYGGWCAYAMADGNYASIDPHAWVIHEGRLYLNYSRRINRRFEGAIDAFIESADRAWRALAED